jgi:hypothetical protein
MQIEGGQGVQPMQSLRLADGLRQADPGVQKETEKVYLLTHT